MSLLNLPGRKRSRRLRPFPEPLAARVARGGNLDELLWWEELRPFRHPDEVAWGVGRWNGFEPHGLLSELHMPPGRALGWVGVTDLGFVVGWAPIAEHRNSSAYQGFRVDWPLLTHASFKGKSLSLSWMRPYQDPEVGHLTLWGARRSDQWALDSLMAFHDSSQSEFEEIADRNLRMVAKLLDPNEVGESAVKAELMDMDGPGLGILVRTDRRVLWVIDRDGVKTFGECPLDQVNPHAQPKHEVGEFTITYPRSGPDDGPEFLHVHVAPHDLASRWTVEAFFVNLRTAAGKPRQLRDASRVW